jgi:hypothetical protein
MILLRVWMLSPIIFFSPAPQMVDAFQSFAQSYIVPGRHGWAAAGHRHYRHQGASARTGGQMATLVAR